jgi:nucleoid-associated protein YgaU
MSPEPTPKKGLFDNLVNLVSTRDEKEALEKALAELEEAKKSAATANQAAKTATVQAQASARKAADAANQRAANAEARIKQLEEQLRQMRATEAQRAARQKFMEAEGRSAAVVAPKIIAEHTLKSDESLSHLALKYYGHATKPYYMVIYEANKAAIGDDPNRVKVGTVLKIPELPPELKK